MLSLIIYVIIIIFLVIMSMFLPIGNENSTVRRVPWVTFSIMAINVVIYYATLPMLAGDLKEISKAGTELDRFMEQHQELLADEAVRQKMVDMGLIPKRHAESIKNQLKQDPETASQYDSWLRSADAEALRKDLDKKLSD